MKFEAHELQQKMILGQIKITFNHSLFYNNNYSSQETI